MANIKLTLAALTAVLVAEALDYGRRTEKKGSGMNMKDIEHPEMSNKIRAALKEADAQGRLGAVAASVGIAGGISELTKIMNSEGVLPLMDRGILAMHLNIASA